MTEPIVKVQGIKKTYISDKGDHIALAGVDFDVARGEVVSIVGPSGAGKTTVLRIIAGLLTRAPDAWRWPANRWRGNRPSRWGWCSRTTDARCCRGCRSPATWRCRCAPRASTGPVPARWHSVPWTRWGSPAAARPTPRELSGGMQQRVAIARALAYEPQLLLMDEPFASVDAQTRMDLEDLVLPPRDQFGITVVIVTHDVDEAVYLSDRVIVLTPPPSVVSRIVEVDLPKPRDQQRTKDDVRFARLRGEVLDLVRGREPEARAA